MTRVALGTSPTVSLWTDEAALTNDQAGIWQGGGVVVQDPQRQHLRHLR